MFCCTLKSLRGLPLLKMLTASNALHTFDGLFHNGTRTMLRQVILGVCLRINRFFSAHPDGFNTLLAGVGASAGTTCSSDISADGGFFLLLFRLFVFFVFFVCFCGLYEDAKRIVAKSNLGKCVFFFLVVGLDGK